MIGIKITNKGIIGNSRQEDKLREAGIRYLGDYSENIVMYTVLQDSDRKTFDELLQEVSRVSGEKVIFARFNNDIIGLKDGKEIKLDDKDKLKVINSILNAEYPDNPQIRKAMFEIMIGKNKLERVAKEFEVGEDGLNLVP